MSATARLLMGNMSGESKRIITGTKASRYSSRDGLAFNIDSDNMKSKIKTELAGFGKGKTRFQFVDDDGAVDTTAVFESGGITFNPNTDGIFTMVDEGYLEYEKKIADELEDYIDTVAEYCTSDRICKLIFNLPDREFNQVFGSLDDASMATRFKMSNELMKQDARPDYMKSLLPNSQQFAASASKLRKLIEYFRPIIQSKKETESSKGKGQPGSRLRPDGTLGEEGEAEN